MEVSKDLLQEFVDNHTEAIAEKDRRIAELEAQQSPQDRLEAGAKQDIVDLISETQESGALSQHGIESPEDGDWDAAFSRKWDEGTSGGPDGSDSALMHQDHDATMRTAYETAKANGHPEHVLKGHYPELYANDPDFNDEAS